MSRDGAVYLRHVLLCADRVRAYTAEGREAFLADSKTQDAVIRNLEIIGQAIRDFGPDELTSREPGVPWQQVAGLRNVLAHQYLGVDVQLVWNVVHDHLPALRAAVEALLGRQSPT